MVTFISLESACPSGILEAYKFARDVACCKRRHSQDEAHISQYQGTEESDLSVTSMNDFELGRCSLKQCEARFGCRIGITQSGQFC